MPDSYFVSFMAGVSTAAQNAGIDEARITIGTWEQAVASEELYQNIGATGGFYLWIEPPSGRQSHVPPDALAGDFALTARLLSTVPADTTTGWTDFYNQLAALLDALANIAPWYSGDNRAAVSVDFELPEILRHEKPYVVFSKLTLHGRYIAGTVSNPPLNP